jgi:hypothetical protein
VKFVCPGWVIGSAHESKLLNSLRMNVVPFVCSEIYVYYSEDVGLIVS